MADVRVNYFEIAKDITKKASDVRWVRVRGEVVVRITIDAELNCPDLDDLEERLANSLAEDLLEHGIAEQMEFEQGGEVSVEGQGRPYMDGNSISHEPEMLGDFIIGGIKTTNPPTKGETP